MAHKTDLVKIVANETGLSLKDSGSAVDAFLNSIIDALKSGGPVTLIGFGTFKAVKRKARKGRNPQTGEEIQIKAANTVKFSIGKGLKDNLN